MLHQKDDGLVSVALSASIELTLFRTLSAVRFERATLLGALQAAAPTSSPIVPMIALRTARMETALVMSDHAPSERRRTRSVALSASIELTLFRTLSAVRFERATLLGALQADDRTQNRPNGNRPRHVGSCSIRKTTDS
jgi:hypothetical protein